MDEQRVGKHLILDVVISHFPMFAQAFPDTWNAISQSQFVIKPSRGLGLSSSTSSSMLPSLFPSQSGSLGSQIIPTLHVTVSACNQI